MDITERMRAEETRASPAAIVESSEDAIISKRLDGTIVSWNRGAKRLYGYKEVEVVGKPLSILLPPDRAGKWPAPRTPRASRRSGSHRSTQLHLHVVVAAIIHQRDRHFRLLTTVGNDPLHGQASAAVAYGNVVERFAVAVVDFIR